MSWPSREYRDAHRAVAARLTTEEYKLFTELAARHGMKPTTLATQELRQVIANRSRRNEVTK